MRPQSNTERVLTEVYRGNRDIHSIAINCRMGFHDCRELYRELEAQGYIREGGLTHYGLYTIGKPVCDVVSIKGRMEQATWLV